MMEGGREREREQWRVVEEGGMARGGEYGGGRGTTD